MVMEKDIIELIWREMLFSIVWGGIEYTTSAENVRRLLNTIWKMLDLQHQYNNCTTISHMRVGPTYWGPPSCEGLLYSCCIGVVQESNPIAYIMRKKKKKKVVLFSKFKENLREAVTSALTCLNIDFAVSKVSQFMC